MEEWRRGLEGRERERGIVNVNKFWSSFAQPVHCSNVASPATQQMALLHSTLSVCIDVTVCALTSMQI